MILLGNSFGFTTTKIELSFSKIFLLLHQTLPWSEFQVKVTLVGRIKFYINLFLSSIIPQTKLLIAKFNRFIAYLIQSKFTSGRQLCLVQIFDIDEMRYFLLSTTHFYSIMSLNCKLSLHDKGYHILDCYELQEI